MHADNKHRSKEHIFRMQEADTLQKEHHIAHTSVLNSLLVGRTKVNRLYLRARFAAVILSKINMGDTFMRRKV